MFYTKQKINENLYAIKSASGEFVFLVIGEQKAMLIDTCLGYGNLMQFVQTITDKELIVVMTHGHVDHALGAPEYETAYMNKADIELYQEHSKLEHRIGYMKANLAPDFIFDENLVVKPDENYEFKSLDDNQSFDLGQITVSFHSLAGHTTGMMVALIEELEILIISDACNNSTFLFDEYSLSVEEYKQNLLEIEKRLSGKYKQVMISHHVLEITPSIMSEMIELCDQIISGDVDNIPFNFMGHEAYIAKNCDKQFNRLDGKSANLIYNPNKIRKSE